MESPLFRFISLNIFTKRIFPTFIDEICFAYYQWMWRILSSFCGSNWNPLKTIMHIVFMGIMVINNIISMQLMIYLIIQNILKILNLSFQIFMNLMNQLKSFQTVDKDVSSF
ncbi:hypothetical protein M0811_12614 [Anaeramoeba ignava]|uniref:Uncharacterized protein n=1 Tax=Anaeramoeba ignava TaxID=1746090 RepID=A0A9Q0R5N2_ANAIG|nr:hypothetical protein M0811_12614 [Anaeramoeba ignava]